jgi:hypothetical protein
MWSRVEKKRNLKVQTDQLKVIIRGALTGEEVGGKAKMADERPSGSQHSALADTIARAS